jgi:hypothetical protein
MVKNSMRKSNETKFSAITLRYYKAPERSDTSAPSFECAWCLKWSNRTGGGFYDKDGNPHQICEECAVRRYKEDNKFKTLAAARARRRRIFDVGYLFNEMVLDLYMERKGIENFESFKKSNKIFISASQLYNHLFSKEDKMRLEETNEQSDIESEIKRRLQSIHLGPLFDSW